MRARTLPLFALLCLTNACIFVTPGEESNPDDTTPTDTVDPPEEALSEVASVTVVGITPHADFATTGLVDIALLPKDAAGEAIIDAALTFSPTVDNADLTVEATDITEKEPDPDKELSSLLDLDSSGSMSGNDPNELRKDAAKQFIDQLDTDDMVSVCDFGAGSSDPFTDTRLLSDFTIDRSTIYEAIDQVTSSGGTPMFRSIIEVLDFYNAAYPPGDTSRSLVVLGDGEPNGGGTLEDACLKAQETGIPINTIGFGPAADQSPEASTEAVQTLRDLADCSGGAYTGVVDAAELGEAFGGFGEAARSGSVTITVRFDPIPMTGSTISGTVGVGNGEQIPIEVEYQFVAP